MRNVLRLLVTGTKGSVFYFSLLLFLYVALCRLSFAQTLNVTPGAQALTIHPGDADVALPVTLTSDGSYTGPFTITLTGLPSGISVSSLLLTPGGSGILHLSASVSAGQEFFPANDPAEPDTGSTNISVVAYSGFTQATAPVNLTVSLENPSFTPSKVNIPVVKIDTGGTAITSTTTDVPGTMTITSADGSVSYLPNSSDSDNTASFHVHGNSTALMPKLPYDVKLNTSLDLLTQMGLTCPYATSSGKPVCDKSKSFVLLANYDDKTMLRDWTASALANAMPIGGAYLGEPAGSPSPSGTSALMPWAAHSLFVELYLNGEYEGTYQLIEEVKVDSHRVNITEMADTDTSGTALTGGYLMVLDLRQLEDFNFITPHGEYVGLEDPDFTPEMSEQTSYIQNYVDTAEAAMFSGDYTSSTTGWRAYFSDAALVNYYIVNDIMGNRDGGSLWDSAYLYKDRNNPLLYMGPIWDFDVSSGNDNLSAVKDPTVPWVQVQSAWYSRLFTDPSFKAEAAQQWNALKNNGVFSNWLASIPTQAATLELTQANNFGRWPMQGIRVWPNTQANGSYDGEVSYLVDWLTLRIGYMDGFLNGTPATNTTLFLPTGTLRTGTPVTLTAKVTGNDPTGTVTFSYNSIILGQAPLDGTGTATLTVSTLQPGSWYIEAYYNGDNGNAISGALGPLVTVLPPLVETATNLTTSAVAALANSTVTLTSVVVGVSGNTPPTGAVTFTANGTVLGTAPLSNGVATLPTDALTAGSTPVQAVYGGDLFYATSTSNVDTVSIAGLALANLSATYDGNPHAATVTTTPQGLSANVTYNGSTSVPVAVGTYAVVASLSSAGYTGSVSGTLIIGRAAATVSLAGESATYDGQAHAVTATTSPAGLSVALTYNGASTAPTAAGTYAVVATLADPNYSGSATGTLTIAAGNATIALSSLNAVYNTQPHPAVVTTSPAGLNVAVSYNGASVAPSAPGSYPVVATVQDPNYAGSATGTLIIAKGAAVISLGNLSATYNAGPQYPTVTTNPSGLNVVLTYNGANTAPSSAGSYSVTATVNDPNYAGSATGTLTIGKGAAVISLGDLSATYNAEPQYPSVTTNPSGLNVLLAYNGASTAPAAAGSYAVVATVSDPNYTGSATGTLSIAKANPTVSWTPAPITYGTALSSTQLNASSSVPGALTYTPASGAVLPAGTQALMVTLAPADGTDYNSVTKTTQLTVGRQATTVTLSSAASTVNPNQALNITAAVIAASSGTPTGTMSLFDGTTPLSTQSLNGSIANFSIPGLTPGPHNLTASYSGDGNYVTSQTSAPLGIAARPLDFTLTATESASATLEKNTSATFAFAIAPMYGLYPGPVTTTITGLPPGFNYTVSPATVAADAGPQTLQTIVTPASQTTSTSSFGGFGEWGLAVLLLSLPMLSRRRALARYLLLLLSAVALCSPFVGCGQSEAPQTYMLTISAVSGNEQHTSTVTLVVRK